MLRRFFRYRKRILLHGADFPERLNEIQLRFQNTIRAVGSRRKEDVTEGCQATVMESIYGSCGIKAGYSDLASAEGQHNAALLRGQQEALVKDGAACVLAGCTEIPLVLQEEEDAGGSGALVNPTRVLADMIVWRSLRDRM